MREGPVSQDSAYIPAPDMIAQKIVEELQAALAQLKLARCPHSLTASLAATAVRLGPLITRTARCLRQLPSCVAVYPRDSRSHMFYVAHPIHSIHQTASDLKR